MSDKNGLVFTESLRTVLRWGWSMMMDIRTGLSTQIQNKVTAAHKTHCHGHALSLAVKDTTKKSRLLTDTMSTTEEICTLVKFSPKGEQFLENIKKT